MYDMYLDLLVNTYVLVATRKLLRNYMYLATLFVYTSDEDWVSNKFFSLIVI